ncbi:MAG: hypothetical protein QM765_28545 [Myxococcales bacterium]
MPLRISGSLPLPPAQQSASGPGSSAFQQRLQQRQAVGGSSRQTAPVASDATSQALDLLAQQQASNLQYLKLQHELGSPRHSVISNCLKARHDTLKNSISNLR